MSAVEVISQLPNEAISAATINVAANGLVCPECGEVGCVRRLGRCMTCVYCGWSACTK